MIGTGVVGAGYFQLIKRAGNVLVPQLDFAEPLKLECAHFVQCVETGKTPITDGRNGLRVVRVLGAATKCMAAGGATVRLAADA
jgi:predicted dehydrogenase